MKYENGKLVKSGGRKKGTPNKSTIAKRKAAQEMITLMAENGVPLMEVILTQALGGCRSSQKLVMDRMVPVGETNPVATGTGGVVVNIIRKEPEEVVIDGVCCDRGTEEAGDGAYQSPGDDADEI